MTPQTCHPPQKPSRAHHLVHACWLTFALLACQADVKPEAVPTSAGEASPRTGAARFEGFWQYWGDGKAELNGYDLLLPRYGEKRRGRAVMVFVTEPYSRSQKVKTDYYDRNNPDHLQALKLNKIEKFQTGIYDYSTMTSVFTEPAREFKPLEVTFSMQEWCGMLFEEVHFDDDKAIVNINSYFEGESTRSELPMGDAGVMAEDAIWIALRGLASAELPRDPQKVTLLGSALRRRMRHVKATPYETTVRWSDAPKKLKVPAGEYEVYEATWGRQGSGSCTAQIEAPYPHRVVGWTCSDGTVARLTGTTRLDYWRTHNEGDEALLRRMGLEPLNFAPTSTP